MDSIIIKTTPRQYLKFKEVFTEVRFIPMWNGNRVGMDQVVECRVIGVKEILEVFELYKVNYETDPKKHNK